MSSVIIPGPAGNLEAELDEAPSGRYAVLCHPHPQYGGTMDDAVVGVARERWMATGGGVVRFNFRGVGASEGKYDSGEGEIDDVVAVAQWLRQHHDVEFLLLGGYSFGALMVLKAVPELLGVTRHLLLIAPPTENLFASRSSVPPTTVISGTADTFADAETLQEIERAEDGVTLRLIDGADHFFQGAFDALGTALTETFEGI